MANKILSSSFIVACISAFIQPALLADDPPPPAITNISIAGTQQILKFTPFPAAQEYRILSTPSLNDLFSVDTTGSVSGYNWTGTSTQPAGFYRLQVNPLNSNALLTASVLNRLAYGPTPDELERVTAIGPQAYIDEQLAPELIQETLDIDTLPTNSESGWRYITATGTGSTSVVYVYLNSLGDGYIDDITLVSGTVAGVGNNLIRNGGFESPLVTSDWTISSNHFGTAVSTDVKHSGNASLHLIASSAGTTRDSSVFQTVTPSLSGSQQYTLSYWYLPGTNNRVSLTVRLSGEGIASTSDGPLVARLSNNTATIADLRTWHVLHAVQSRRQLLEILLQFCDNHFVTQYSKSHDYFDQFYDDPVTAWQSVQLEFKEIQKWRQALLNPSCTFYDLLRVSAESPAMIIYLDTVNSRGDGSNIANENYARELLELFTFGVDNGYDQNDITVMSRAWTGWSVRLVDAANEFNPFALQTTNRIPNAPNGNITNLVGIWTFNYRQERHNNTAKTIFPGKTVPSRFGAPYAGRNYQLALPARSGTNSIQDGYQVIAHFADQPFTQEFISIKLCRLFVHDNFPNPSNDPASPNYDFYNYAAGNLSPEANLVHQCMLAWENGSPKGQIRQVLTTIFNSDLFRSHGGSLQKIKTPFEFTVSAARALRSANADGTFTANTDGNLSAAIIRMGNMKLFDRDEPDGFPEAGPPWISAGTLAERLRFVQALLIAPGQPGRTDAGNNTTTDPVALLKKKLPAASLTDVNAVADYFLSILYPAEGKANLDLYRNAAISFLNTADDGVNSSRFSGLSMTGNPSPYDTRVRGMVAMLMTFQRFQEQ